MWALSSDGAISLAKLVCFTGFWVCFALVYLQKPAKRRRFARRAMRWTVRLRNSKAPREVPRLVIDGALGLLSTIYGSSPLRVVATSAVFAILYCLVVVSIAYARFGTMSDIGAVHRELQSVASPSLAQLTDETIRQARATKVVGQRIVKIADNFHVRDVIGPAFQGPEWDSIRSDLSEFNNHFERRVQQHSRAAELTMYTAIHGTRYTPATAWSVLTGLYAMNWLGDALCVLGVMGAARSAGRADAVKSTWKGWLKAAAGTAAIAVLVLVLCRAFLSGNPGPLQAIGLFAALLWLCMLMFGWHKMTSDSGEVGCVVVIVGLAAISLFPLIIKATFGFVGAIVEALWFAISQPVSLVQAFTGRDPVSGLSALSCMVPLLLLVVVTCVGYLVRLVGGGAQRLVLGMVLIAIRSGTPVVLLLLTFAKDIVDGIEQLIKLL